jgi:iron complex outermembrane receptor protein
LTYRLEADRWQGSASVFYTYFEDYIFQENLGFQTDVAGVTEFEVGFDAGDALDTFQYSAVDAAFWGFETELSYRFYQTDTTELTLSLMAVYVRAENRDSGDPIPRIPPLRIGTRLDFKYYTWDFGAQIRRAIEHDNTAPGETTTDGYTQFDLDLSKRFPMGNNYEWTLFVQAKNLLDEEIRYSTSFLKDSAPLPGRSIQVGARFEF